MTAPSIAFDRAAGYYDETRGYPDGLAREVAAELAAAGKMRGNHRLLEIGVGTGRMALPLSDHVGGVVGVDLAIPMLQRLVAKRTEEPVSALKGDAMRLPFADDCFDRALSMHIFHLVSDWRRAATELARVLRPGGVFVEARDGYALRGVWDEVNARLPWNRSNLAAKHIPEDFPTQAGFELEAAERRFKFVCVTHLPTVLDQLRRRVWSSSWKLSEDQLTTLVSTFEEVAIKHYGSAAATIDDPREVSIRVYRPA